MNERERDENDIKCILIRPNIFIFTSCLDSLDRVPGFLPKHCLIQTVMN